MIGRIFGLGTVARDLGGAVSDVAQVFVGSRAEREAADHARFVKSLAQYSEEFHHPALGWFDQAVNGMNRLPRPMMAVGTLGLFAYAMVDPAGFSMRMQGLAHVPEPLWWLLGAIVSFYFGARELHHYRGRRLGVEAGAAPSLDAAAPAGATGVAPRASGEPAAQAGTLASAGPARVVAGPRPVARPQPSGQAAAGTAGAHAKAGGPRVAVEAENPTFNAALEEWRLTA